MIDLTPFAENSEIQIAPAGEKAPAQRTARAGGYINISPDAVKYIAGGKSDILAIARVAAIQAAKQTSALLPLRYSAPLAHVRVDFDVDVQLARIKAVVTAATESKTGAEMEALTGVNIALLAIYDMLKTIDSNMVISQIHLEEQTGGGGAAFTFDNSLENLDY